MRWALFFCTLISTTLAHADIEALLWRDAINTEVLHGELILEAPEGVAQIETADKLYQVAHLREAEDAVVMLKTDAQKRNRTPELIVIVDGPRDDWTDLIELKNRLARNGIRLQLANSMVKIEKVKGLHSVENPNQQKVKSWSAGAAPTAPTAPSAPQSPSISTQAPNAKIGQTYWLNTKSKIRHNKDCRYFGKGKNGRPATHDEGKACKICGG